MALYGKLDYWDRRYQETKHHPPCEWYLGYGHLRHLLNPIVFTTTANNNNHKEAVAANPTNHYFPDRAQARILMLGCGNSTLGADMQRDGWLGPMVQMDWSQIVLEQMKARYDGYDGQQPSQSSSHLFRPTGAEHRMQFVCADITEPLDFESESFDLIICKGALDAVLCSEGSKDAATRMVQECHRLLAPGHGVLFVVSNQNSDNRLEFLEHKNSLEHYWRGVSVHPMHTSKSKQVYCYICRSRAHSTDDTYYKEHHVATTPLAARTAASLTFTTPGAMESSHNNKYAATKHFGAAG